MKRIILLSAIAILGFTSCKKDSLHNPEIIESGVWVSQNPFLQLTIKEKNDLVIQQYKENGTKHLRLTIGEDTWIYTVKIINNDFIVLVDINDSDTNEIILRKIDIKNKNHICI